MVRVGSGCRLYRTNKQRALAVARLLEQGFNYFVGFRDVNRCHYGLSFGNADWVKTETCRGYYRKDC